MNIKSIILLLLIFSGMSKAISKEHDSLRKNKFVASYLTVGTGVTLNHIKDDIMSPVNYYGIAFNLFPSIIFEREKSINRYNITASLGNMTNFVFGHSGSAFFLQADLDYYHLRKLKKSPVKGTIFYLGGGLNTSNNFRWHSHLNNSSFLYADFFSLSMTAAIRKNFHFWRNDWYLYYQLATPFISTDIRPNYIGVINFIEPEPNYVGEIMDLMTVSTFNKYFRLNSRIEFSSVLKNGNELVFTYIWDYYTFRKRHRIDAAYHVLGISIFTKL